MTRGLYKATAGAVAKGVSGYSIRLFLASDVDQGDATDALPTPVRSCLGSIERYPARTRLLWAMLLLTFLFGSSATGLVAVASGCGLLGTTAVTRSPFVTDLGVLAG